MIMETKYMDATALNSGEKNDFESKMSAFSSTTPAFKSTKRLDESHHAVEEEDDGVSKKKQPKSTSGFALSIQNHAQNADSKKLSTNKSSSIAFTPGAGKRSRSIQDRSMNEEDSGAMFAQVEARAAAAVSNPTSSSGGTAQSQQPSDPNCLKVPPLRIVISSSATRTNLKDANSVEQQSATSSSASLANASRAYMIYDSEQTEPEKTRTPADAAPSGGRVTRSQRAAAASSQPSTGDEGSRGSAGDVDNQEGSLDPSHKSEKESNKENKEHRRRKGRGRASAVSLAQPAAVTQPLNFSATGGEPGIEEDTDSMSSSQSANVLAMPTYNCLHMYQSIRKQVERRRQGMFEMSLSPKAPAGFKQYLLTTGKYTLDGRMEEEKKPIASESQVPSLLEGEEQLSQLYRSQEQERENMRIQHRVEKEKLKLSIEQETLRVHGRAALAMANQSLPLSFATIMKDEEIYNTLDGDADEKCLELLSAAYGLSSGSVGNTSTVSGTAGSSTGSNSRNEYSRATYSCVGNSSLADLFTLTGNSEDLGSRCRFSGRLLHSWLQDVDDKWAKIKKETLFRQKQEAQSLHAIQKLHWQWKCGEVSRKIALLLDEDIGDISKRRSHEWNSRMADNQLVPLVNVSDDFDLV